VRLPVRSARKMTSWQGRHTWASEYLARIIGNRRVGQEDGRRAPSAQSGLRLRRRRPTSRSAVSSTSTRLPVRRQANWRHSSTDEAQSSSGAPCGRTKTVSTSLRSSASPRANKPKTMTLTGRTGSFSACRPRSPNTWSRQRLSARTNSDATFSGTKRKRAVGGASRRSTMPSRARPGRMREAWAGLTSTRRATVRRLSSPVVSARTARTRPCAPGTTACTGRRKSIR
jgi:hypothetical protein